MTIASLKISKHFSDPSYPSFTAYVNQYNGSIQITFDRHPLTAINYDLYFLRDASQNEALQPICKALDRWIDSNLLINEIRDRSQLKPLEAHEILERAKQTTKYTQKRAKTPKLKADQAVLRRERIALARKKKRQQKRELSLCN